MPTTLIPGTVVTVAPRKQALVFARMAAPVNISRLREISACLSVFCDASCDRQVVHGGIAVSYYFPWIPQTGRNPRTAAAAARGILSMSWPARLSDFQRDACRGDLTYSARH